MHKEGLYPLKWTIWCVLFLFPVTVNVIRYSSMLTGSFWNKLDAFDTEEQGGINKTMLLATMPIE